MDIAFVSLGCDKNLVDSEIMLGLINEQGYHITDDEEHADVVIINTCGFIMDATQEGIDNILNIAEQKKLGNVKAIIVTGCMAQRYKKEIFDEIPEVDAIVGTGDFENIGDVIKQVMEGKKVQLITDNNRNLSESLSHKRMITTPSYFAYLKIAEGCDNHCTYCTIPSIRGKFRSRHLDSLVQEATILAENGVKEIVLVAQDTASYGIDLYGANKLHELLFEISKIEQIKWIRILYCYPEKITEETINEIARNDKVCKYLDIPIQHSEDNILKLMARKMKKQDLIKTINNLRDKIPNIVLRTTLISGFPGESEQDFINLTQFIKDMKFNKLGVFAYSQEDGTPAAKLPNQLEDDVKIKRRDILMEMQNYISNEINKMHIGKTLEVIVDGFLPEENVYCGRSYMDCYDIDGFVFFPSDYEILSGDVINIKIKEASDYDLIGEIVDEFSK